MKNERNKEIINRYGKIAKFIIIESKREKSVARRKNMKEAEMLEVGFIFRSQNFKILSSFSKYSLGNLNLIKL